jgi:hypothetical protein
MTLHAKKSVVNRIFPYVIALWLCPVFVFLIFPRASSDLSPIYKGILFHGVFLFLFGVGFIPYFLKRVTFAEFVLWGFVPFLVLIAIIAPISR